MTMVDAAVERRYQLAREQYASLGVDTDSALETLSRVPISMHCWQGDDVVGFEHGGGGPSGGILATGNYPGKARTPLELREDLEQAFSLIPGKKRVNVHAIYLDAPERVERNKIRPEHFRSWIDWAAGQRVGMDFNPTFFGHPMAASQLTLSHPDAAVREFWIEHLRACRGVAAEIGRRLGTPCIMNIWVPDGFKDVTVDRAGARERLAASLDAALAESLPKQWMRDAVEPKLFGIGVESCTVGSAEFYLGYAIRHNLVFCLDSGHFHPTEVISDKISAVLQFVDEILLHVSRPVRWDSDHVVVLDDELRAIAREIVRQKLERIHIGLDYFDGTINRLIAWVVGMRNMQKALLEALLEPAAEWMKLERSFQNGRKLALMEEHRLLPLGAVYDWFCLRQGVPAGSDYLQVIDEYERRVLSRR